MASSPFRDSGSRKSGSKRSSPPPDAAAALSRSQNSEERDDSSIGAHAFDTASAAQSDGGASPLPSVTLPKGGGAIRGLGEKFAVNPANGTASMSLPLPLARGRGDSTPSLNLSYDSASGNGVFGFGWSLNAPAITRKTDKGLPQYRDGDESDVFILSDAEDLVPVLDATGARRTQTRTVFGTAFTIAYYRPRIEGIFARIERWVAVGSGETHWRSISRDDVCTLFGYDAASRVANPANGSEIFCWRISRCWDNKGNVIVYSYANEDSAGITRVTAHEANRTPGTRAAQTHLKTIEYGNITPWFPNYAAASEPALPTAWMFSVVLDYGDHTASPPTPQPDQAWPLRPDPFSSYRAGFEIRTYRRVQRLLFFNNFPNEATAGAACLVRSLDLTYSDQQAPADPRNPIYTFLVAITRTGYRAEGGATLSRSLPPLEFSYSQPAIQSTVQRLDPDSLGNLPEGIDDSRFRWIDLDGEGLSGILMPTPGGWFYKRNLGADNLTTQPDGSAIASARFGPMQPVAALPNRMELEVQQFLDLAGDGQLDAVALAEPDAGFFKRTGDYDFEPFKRFAALPQLDWLDPNIKFIDLTGDGLADILMTEDGLFTFYESLGETGFDIARMVHTPWDEEVGPKVVLADGTDTIFIADMSGDGLNDIVRVRNGEACYWPNIGYARFGAKVTMDQAPRFDNEERFDPSRIRLADIDGSGSADLLYVAEDGVRAWFNQSGNAWSAPTVLAVFPSADRLSSVQVFDLLGSGTACLVWSSPLPAQAVSPLLYVDLTGGKKPHLMTSARNNLGGETRVTYAPSTQFYVADLQAGHPWVTRLPFPVQVVARQETIDWIGRNRQVARYAYHHGYFDGYEREFRGFGMVEKFDTEEFRVDTLFNDGAAVNWDQQSWSPPIRSRSWFHTGAFLQAPRVTRVYDSEYWVEPALAATDPTAMRPPDTVLPVGLDAYETQEAYRALKGHPLRVEVYADDGVAVAVNPYTVTESNYTLVCLQNRGVNLHAVFFVTPRESLSLNYERDGADPRIAHEVTLQTDNYGNPMRAISVFYPRRAGYAAPEPQLSAAAQGMLAYDQTRLHVRATERQYTNAIDDLTTWPDSYRAPLSAAVNVAEITGVAPLPQTGLTPLFAFADLDTTWQTAWTGAHDIPFEAVPASDIDGSGAPAAALTRRVIGQSRTFWRSDDLTALLPQGQLQPLALSGQSCQAAFTPGQLAAIFGALAPAATLAEGGYVQLAGETGWWSPSSRVYLSPGDADTPAQELANAQAQFYLPRRAVDPFGSISRVDYDAYALLAKTVTDPVGNAITATNDYRVLAPAMVTDANGNRAAVAFDSLGQVTATAVMGKTTQTLGDLLSGFAIDPDATTLAAAFATPMSAPATLLGDATTRLVYDLAAYQRTSAAAQPSPPAVATLARETHVSDLTRGGATRYQYAFAYSDGYGREIQRKALVADGPLTTGGATISPRWVGSGWTIFNNKGQPVRRYEPFFSSTNQFEFAAQSGVSAILFYDPPGRPVATLHPDNSWEKTAFTAWRRENWDRNDTVLIADPRADADVGAYFTRCLAGAPFTSWYAARIGGGFGATSGDQAEQKDAAQKAAAHAATFSVTHFDAPGRACLVVVDNGGGARFPNRTAFDTEGKPLALFDGLGRRAQENCFRASQSGGGFQYVAGVDLAGRPVYHLNADAGGRRTIANAAGNTIRLWDARGQAFRTLYDAAQRPVRRFVSSNGAPEILIALTIYGEGQAPANLCGQVFRHYDMAGFTENTTYDFKANILSARRQLATAYRQAIDWTPLSGQTNAAALDAAATAAGLIPGNDGGQNSFVSETVYDALNRPIQTVTPHSVSMRPNVLQPGYDAGAQPFSVDAWLQQAAAPTALIDAATADRHAVTAIAYNARGQPLSVAFGNGATTDYDYDSETFRLMHITTTRPSSFAANQQTVQALAYYYDPVGNVTHIADSADTQNVIYFNNRRVEPSADYTYDPLYRLIAASGREHLGQTGGALGAPSQVSNDDSFRLNLPQPGDGQAMGVYTETYAYDAAGNLLTMAHQVSSGNWTRRYAYNEISRIVATETANRLSATSQPGDPANGPFTATCAYDAHGEMTRMPHLPSMVWDEEDRLRSSTRQVVNAGTPVTSFYVYGFDSGRIRKRTDGQAAAGQSAVSQSERIYLGAVEVFRQFAADGATISLARETLHIAVGDVPVALVETRTSGADAGPAQQVRYQFGNHLGSATLELDDQSGIISYEEYFPFGSTSYQAVAIQTDVAKRYRYTGKERDAENDLYYHGSRYYAPWLGRWTACDPAGLGDGLNICAYARNNPVRLNDPSGTQGDDKTAPDKTTKDKTTKTLNIDWDAGTEYYKADQPAATPPPKNEGEKKDEFVGYIGKTEPAAQDPKLIPPPKYPPVTITDLGTIQSAEGTARAPGIQVEGVAKLQLTAPTSLTAQGSVRWGVAAPSPNYRLDAGFTLGASVDTKGNAGLVAGGRLHLGSEEAPNSWDKSGFGGYASVLTISTDQGQTASGQVTGAYSRKFGDNVEVSANVDVTLSGKGQVSGQDVSAPLVAGGVAGVQIGLPGNYALQPEAGLFGNVSLASGQNSASVLYGVGLTHTDDKASRQWGFSLEGTSEIGTGTTVILMFGYGYARDLSPPPQHVGY